MNKEVIGDEIDIAAIARLQYQVLDTKDWEQIMWKEIERRIKQMKNTICYVDEQFKEYDEYTLAIRDIVAVLSKDGSSSPNTQLKNKAKEALRLRLKTQIEDEALIAIIKEELSYQLKDASNEEKFLKYRQLFRRKMLSEAELDNSERRNLQREVEFLLDRKRIGLIRDSIISETDYQAAIDRESPQRRRLAELFNTQLNRQVGTAKIKQFDNIIGIPVVGFGNQTALFKRTLPLLETQPGKNLYIFFVNYPAGQLPDQTINRLLEAESMMGEDSDQQYCITLSVTGTP